MTPERWQQVTGIFHAALTRDAAQRAAFVASSCGADEGLYREVASMLAAHQEAGDFGEAPASVTAPPVDADPSVSPWVPRCGTRFGPYQVASLIGVGGMGAVYRARDTRLHRDVALKVLLPAVAADHDRLARFSEEARVLATLNHPNIVQVHGLEDSDPSAGSGRGSVRALVMELVDGPTLADRIARGAIPVDEARTIAAQMAEALEAAHEHGVIHRDLKPANVKVRPDGTVKVLDFGLAKALQGTDRAEQAPATTMPGVILGTTSYMAPEQAKGTPVDRRADIWAFGCVLFEMLTGRRAFAGETPSDVLVGIIEREPDWQTLPAGTPAAIRRLLRRSVEKDPRRRLDSAAVARIELDEAARERAPVVPSTGPRSAAAWRPMLWAATGAGAALVVAMMSAGRARSPQLPAPVVTTSFFVNDGPELGQPGVHFAIAPNGSTVVLAGKYGGTPVLLRRDLNRLEAEPIVGTEGGSDVFFSPDGRSLGFETGSQLWTVSLDGGTPQMLFPNQPLRGGTWGEGNTVVIGRVGSGLWIASTTGGEPRQLTTPEQGERHELPQMLPGDRAVLFTILAPTKPPRAAVHLLRTGETLALFEGVGARFVDSGHIVFGRQGKLCAVGFDPGSLQTFGAARVVRDDVLWSPEGYPQFAVDGGLLAYVRTSQASGRRGYGVLTLVDRQGRRQRLAFEPGIFLLPRLSPTGGRLVVQIGASRDLWTYDLRRGSRTRLTWDRIIAFSAPAWTPDGSRVIFVTWFDGEVGLGWVPADGSGPVEKLVTSVGMRSFERTDPALLPDGKGVILTGLAPGRTVEDLLFVPLTGEPRLETLLQAAGVERNPAVSPSARFVAYNSDESGRAEVYVRPFPDAGSRKWQISTEGGAGPVWTRGEDEIVYRESQGRMMAVAVRSDGNHDVAFSRPEPLFTIGDDQLPGLLDRAWDVSADGERFLFLESARGAEGQASAMELVLVQNWGGELTRVVPRERYK